MADIEGGRRRRAPERQADDSTSELAAVPPRAPRAKKGAPAKKAVPAVRKAVPAAKKTVRPVEKAVRPVKKAPKKAAPARERTPPPIGAPVTAPRPRTRKKAAGSVIPVEPVEPIELAEPIEPVEPVEQPEMAKREFGEYAPEPEPEPEPPAEDRRASLRALLAEAAARAAAEREGQSGGTTAAPPRPAEPVVVPPERELESQAEAELESQAEAEAEPQAPPATPPPPRWEPTATAETAVIPTPTDAPPPTGAAATSGAGTPAPAAPTAAPPAEKPSRRQRDRGGGDGRTGRTVGLIAGIAVLVALLLVGGLILVNNISDDGGVRYSDLKAGDCFQRPSGQFNNVTTVACTERHDLEVYAVLDHPDAPDAPFPGMETLVRYANPLCLAQFRGYAGVPFEQLTLQDVYITPRESAWKDGARRLVCAVGSGNNEPMTKSIKAGTP